MKVINWKKFVPVLIITIVVIVFDVVFLDNLVKWMLEKGLSAAAGARANIAKLDLRLKDFSLNIYNLQVANKNDVWKNLVDITRIRTALDGNAFKYRRFIIDEVTVEGLKFGTKRKYSGALPFSKKTTAKKEGLDLSKLTKSLGLNKQLAQPVDLNQLGTQKELDRIKAENEQKLAEANKNISGLDVSSKLSAVDLSAFNNLDKIEDLNQLNEKLKAIEKTSQQISQVQEEFTNSQKGIQNNLKQVQDNLKNLDDLKNKDLEKIYATLDIGNYDPKQIVRGLLGPKLNGYIDQATYLLYTAKKYMPPKKKPAKPKKERIQGMDIIFSAREPKFLIRKMALSGTNNKDELNEAYYAGQIINITTEPTILGKPMEIDIKGKFVKNPNSNLAIKGTIDHTQEVSNDNINFLISGYKMDDQTLWDEQSIPLKMKKGNGIIQGNIKLQDDELSGKINYTIDGLAFEKLDTTKGSTEELLANAISKAPKLSIEITLSGKIDSPAIGLNTNLDGLIGTAINELVGDQVNAAKKQVEEAYNKQVGAAQKELQDSTDKQLKEANSLLAKQQAALDSKKAELTKYQDEINQKIEDLKNEQVNKLKDQAGDLLKGALGK